MTAKRRLRQWSGPVLLAASVLFFLFLTGFPHATALGAYRAQERSHLFGPGEVVAVIPTDSYYYRPDVYLARTGDTWAVGVVNHLWSGSLLWTEGAFYTTQNDDARPLVLMDAENWYSFYSDNLLFVLVNDPAIARVEGTAFTEDGPIRLPQHTSGPDWAALDYPYPANARSPIHLRGYDAQDNLIYESAP